MRQLRGSAGCAEIILNGTAAGSKYAADQDLSLSHEAGLVPNGMCILCVGSACQVCC